MSPTRSSCSSHPRGRSCVPTWQSINRYGSAARGVIVMRLNEGDSVAGIAVFREGLAQQRAVGENGEDGPIEEGPDGDGAAQA